MYKMKLKKKILLVPGWWPCLFFMDPSMLMSDIFDTYVLKGDCTVFPLRKAYKYFKSYIQTTDEQNTIDVHLCWLRYKTKWAHNKQNQKLENLIGEAVKQLMGNQLPDLVSIQSLSDISPFVVEWAHRNGIKVIMTEHQLHFRILSDPFSALIYSVYRKVDKLLCVSNYLYRNLLINEFGIDKATVIGNLVDDIEFDESKLTTNRNLNKIVFVTGHPHSKDLHILYEVALLLKDNTNIEIDVIGMGENTIGSDGKPVGWHVRERNITNLHILGRRSHEELLKSYSQYGLLLSTSRSETFGISVAEAILNGLPVVCTDNGGCHEFVNDSNGIIAGIREPQQIYEAILQVLENIKSGKYDPIAMSEMIREKYGRKAYCERLIPIYEQYAR